MGFLKTEGLVLQCYDMSRCSKSKRNSILSIPEMVSVNLDKQAIFNNWRK